MTTNLPHIDAEWVGNGEPVEAFCRTDGDVHGTGVVVAYYSDPTVVIRRLDGSQFTWSAALVRPARGKCTCPTPGPGGGGQRDPHCPVHGFEPAVTS